jgi:hypothetical protein
LKEGSWMKEGHQISQKKFTLSKILICRIFLKIKNLIYENQFRKPIVLKWMRIEYLENWIIIYIWIDWEVGWFSPTLSLKINK